jgi:hypothetical protein
MILPRQLLDILVCKDINETTVCCIKMLRFLVLEVLVCLVGYYKEGDEFVTFQYNAFSTSSDATLYYGYTLTP